MDPEQLRLELLRLAAAVAKTPQEVIAVATAMEAFVNRRD